MTTVELPKTRSIPVWVAILLILACAGGGGYLAYKFLLGGSKEKIVLLERSPNETIRGIGDNEWMMTTSDASRSNGQLRFDFRTADKPRVHYILFRQDLSAEQTNLLWLGQNPQMEDQLELSADQRKKLSALANAAHVEPPKATMDALLTVFTQWKNAQPGKTREDLENKLFSMLSDATQSIDAQSKSRVLEKCARVLSILTPAQQKQIEAIHPRRGW